MCGTQEEAECLVRVETGWKAEDGGEESGEEKHFKGKLQGAAELNRCSPSC